MRAIVLSAELFTAKKTGQAWCRVSLLKEKGQTLNLILSADKAKDLDLLKYALSPKEVVELFSTYKACEVAFDERGSLDSLSE